MEIFPTYPQVIHRSSHFHFPRVVHHLSTWLSAGLSTKAVDNLFERHVVETRLEGQREGMARTPDHRERWFRWSGAGRLELADTGLTDASRKFAHLVKDRTVTGHELGDLSVGIHHRGVIAIAEELADLRQ